MPRLRRRSARCENGVIVHELLAALFAGSIGFRTVQRHVENVPRSNLLQDVHAVRSRSRAVIALAAGGSSSSPRRGDCAAASMSPCAARRHSSDRETPAIARARPVEDPPGSDSAWSLWQANTTWSNREQARSPASTSTRSGRRTTRTIGVPSTRSPRNRLITAVTYVRAPPSTTRHVRAIAQIEQPMIPEELDNEPTGNSSNKPVGQDQIAEPIGSR